MVIITAMWVCIIKIKILVCITSINNITCNFFQNKHNVDIKFIYKQILISPLFWQDKPKEKSHSSFNPLQLCS